MMGVNLAAARGRLGGRRKSLNPDQRALVVSLCKRPSA
ncbi:hypothetical protein NOC27_2556 [Nitrosococcus oceani AFC27]|nr:hypothetical protein NOC27_2556 [Nitrosococcus oceani AFC27]